MNRQDALNLVGMLGRDLGFHENGGRYMKALLILIATSEHPVQDIAGCLGVPEDIQEAAHDDSRAIAFQAYGEDAAQAARLEREGHLL